MEQTISMMGLVDRTLLSFLSRYHQHREPILLDTKYRQMPDFERILVLSTTAIGDTLLSTPTFAALRKEYPHALIKAMIRDKFSCLFENNPAIDGVIHFRPGWGNFLRTLKKVRNQNFQIALVLHISNHLPLFLAVLNNIPYIVGWPPLSETEKFFSTIVTPQPGRHAIKNRLKVVEAITPGRNSYSSKLVLPLDPPRTDSILYDFSQQIGISFDTGIVVGFQPGASRDFKMWPSENFVALGKALLASNRHIFILILGSKKEADIGKAIEQGIDRGIRTRSLCGQIDLAELPYVVSGLRVLVTNDTGTMHIAIAVSTPTVSLFVPTDPATIGPYQDLDIHRVISRPRPCGDECVTKRCTWKPSCMALIPVDEVYETTREVMSA